MLTVEERRLPGDLPLWEVPDWFDRHGVVAGITGRGDPAEPFDLGLHSHAPAAAVTARWRRLRAAFPRFPRTAFAQQVHGTDVLIHRALPDADTTFRAADGHATAIPGTLMLVTVADCIPVYLLEPNTRIVALLHSGWRGTAGRILERGLGAITALGGDRANVLVHLGVGICGACYEVGSEVANAVCGKSTGDAKQQLDLREALADQARQAGVSQITTSRLCSSHDSDRFFSYRRTGGGDGRMVAYLGLEGRPDVAQDR